MSRPQSPTFLPAAGGLFRYVEKSNPHSSKLQFLTYGVYELDGPARSAQLAHPTEESLLFCWKGAAAVALGGRQYALSHYDVLYVPRGAAYELAQDAGRTALVVCRARRIAPTRRFTPAGRSSLATSAASAVWRARTSSSCST